MVFEKGHGYLGGGAKKGCIPWNKNIHMWDNRIHPFKGHTLSDEHKKNLSVARKKRIISEVTKEKIRQSNIGKHYLSDGKKQHLRQINLGKKHSLETREKMRLKKIGKTTSERQKQIVSLLMKNNKYASGRIPWNYIDGKSKFQGTAIYGNDWNKIRHLIYSRDMFICQKCGIYNVSLHVHHKIPFRISHDNSLENLITLCASCHKKEEVIIIKKVKRGELFVECQQI